ncbi:uncharacterized protein Z519_09026 [Cladophialophora bantiana CBS 173.52]|uniref:Uncharacterized protein n=1 Tax=Cladophialophora bantiana (strain ATCC 10958 / CBS 173.52 / CDC B-1940 / NIH 8579) TaxID=1442370 RepID=A0A0D2EK53_CLAB1|nr:uncharacterized protein Z519_09026 [Cladophialophora bantiana CBS 173.52]KIW90381.1 hypothetical protein Z519_09026 [Cladophialophora bantiana CBS 173.52]
MDQAKRSCVPVNNLTRRFGFSDVVAEMVELTEFPGMRLDQTVRCPLPGVGTIVVINNEAYTVERVIHGPAKPHSGSHTVILPNGTINKSYAARTYEDPEMILNRPEFQDSNGLQFLKCFLHKYNAPTNLSWMVK